MILMNLLLHVFFSLVAKILDLYSVVLHSSYSMMWRDFFFSGHVC